MTNDTTIQVLRSVAELEELREQWMQWCDHPNIDLDFYLNVVAARTEVLRPHVVVLRRAGRPHAMLAGRLEHRTVDFKIGYLTLGHYRARVLTFIYGGFLGNSSATTSSALIEEVVTSLRQKEADLAFFNLLGTDSMIFRAAVDVPGLLFRDHFRAPQLHRATGLPQSVEEFYQSLSPKVRKNQKWQAKKLLLDHQGKVQVTQMGTVAELDRAMQDVDTIAAKTYQRGLGAGFVNNDEMRSRLTLEAQKGWLRIFMLYIGGQPVAFWIGSVSGGTLYSSYMGYDPAFAKYSPGMFLIVKVVEGLCEATAGNRVTTIDWGFGDAQYKNVLGNREWSEASVHIFACTPKGLALSLMRMFTTLLDLILKKALSRTELLPQIKKLWRTYLRPKAPVKEIESVSRS